MTSRVRKEITTNYRKKILTERLQDLESSLKLCPELPLHDEIANVSYVLLHIFNVEDLFMERIGYPKRASHKRRHNVISVTAARLASMVDCTKDNLHYLQLLRLLLLEHMELHDAELKSFIEK